MSSEAVTEIGGEKHSAWTYRSMYLSDRIVHNNFYCPYCEVHLIGKNIHVDGEIIKSPHFAAHPNTPHIGECDGEAIDTESSNLRRGRNTSTSREMKYPEELTYRPERKISKAGFASATVIRAPLTFEEVKRRRTLSGRQGRAKPSAYLLQPFVEAYNLVLQEGYEKFKGKENAAKKSEWIKTTLASMALKLDDDTNYQKAFKTPAYPDSRRRIYIAVGKVFLNDGVFTIQGESYAPHVKKYIPFVVYVGMNLLKQGAPKCHDEHVKSLKKFVDTQNEIKFYCYGLCKQSNSDLGESELELSSLDYLYIKEYAVKES